MARRTKRVRRKSLLEAQPWRNGNDNWIDHSTYKCATCRFYVPKSGKIGRCRRRCPVVEIGYPAVYPTDWCGEHKIDENKI